MSSTWEETCKQYPIAARDVAHLRRELRECHEWARSKAAWWWQGKLIGWCAAMRVVMNAVRAQGS